MRKKIGSFNEGIHNVIFGAASTKVDIGGRGIRKKMAKKKVLSCIVILVILMSAMPKVDFLADLTIVDNETRDFNRVGPQIVRTYL